MAEQGDIKELLADLGRCQRAANEMQLDIASVYIAHAIEHVTYLDQVRSASPPTVLRAVKGGKSDY